MTTEHINHKNIVDFADSHVNLKREHTKKYREQVAGLRE